MTRTSRRSPSPVRPRLLLDQQMNPRVVMAVGGWDSFAAIEPYLNAPSEDVIDDAFADVGL